MTEPHTLTHLHATITEALAELRGARDINDHNPCLENQHMVDLAEWRLDILLSRRSLAIPLGY